MKPSPCIAIIGSGGKTTAMLTLAKACQDRRVLITTTTHIYPVSPPESRELLVNPSAQQLKAALSRPGIVCAGMAAKEGKLSGLLEDLFSLGRSCADITLCEADGSRQHPLKLHREGEPVIPAGCDLCLIVLGLSALGQLVSQAVHRWQLCPEWDGETRVSADVLLFCAREALQSSCLPPENCLVLFNQAEGPSQLAAAREVSRVLEQEGLSCRIGSLKEDASFLAPWVLGHLHSS